MKHSARLDEMSEMAALYALDALTQREARAFEEHLAEGCAVCRAELEAFEQTANSIGLAAGEAEPSGSVRDKLITAISNEDRNNNNETRSTKSEQRPFVSIRATDGEWVKIEEGIFIKPLFNDHANGLATTLVKMMPGTALPPHQHNCVEQFFILEGDCTVRGEVLGPGDYHRASVGTIHESTSTEHGTVLLLVTPADYTVLGPQ